VTEEKPKGAHPAVAREVGSVVYRIRTQVSMRSPAYLDDLKPWGVLQVLPHVEMTGVPDYNIVFVSERGSLEGFAVNAPIS
jgi:hypothetical protein